jgi:hypothetical protein
LRNAAGNLNARLARHQRLSKSTRPMATTVIHLVSDNGVSALGVRNAADRTTVLLLMFPAPASSARQSGWQALYLWGQTVPAPAAASWA